MHFPVAGVYFVLDISIFVHVYCFYTFRPSLASVFLFLCNPRIPIPNASRSGRCTSNNFFDNVYLHIFHIFSKLIPIRLIEN